MRLAWQFAQSIASIAPMRALFCITKIPALVVPIARMPAHLAHLSSQVLEPLDCAARWTSAHSVVAVPRKNGSVAEFEKYGRNRLAEGKLPLCAELCSTKALIGGDGDVIADVFRTRVVKRMAAGKNAGADVFGWATAYGKPGAPAPAAKPAGGKS
jgi:hypothetical protein